MLVLKTKYNKLVDDYNSLVDTKNYWEEGYRESQSKVARLETQCNKLYKQLDKLADEKLELEFECDKHKVTKRTLIEQLDKLDDELELADQTIKQYEAYINRLEEELQCNTHNQI